VCAAAAKERRELAGLRLSTDTERERPKWDGEPQRIIELSSRARCSLSRATFGPNLASLTQFGDGRSLACGRGGLAGVVFLRKKHSAQAQLERVEMDSPLSCGLFSSLQPLTAFFNCCLALSQIGHAAQLGR